VSTVPFITHVQKWVFFAGCKFGRGTNIAYSCTRVFLLLFRNFSLTTFFFNFSSGVLLQVCGKSQETCCGENSEPQLVTVGRNLYDDKLQTSLKTLSVMYKEKAVKFDGNFLFL
jgi:hypothetical protein